MFILCCPLQERDTFRNLVEEKEKYIAVLTADKRQLEHEINALKLEKQRIESKHGDLQASISSLQQRADLAEVTPFSFHEIALIRMLIRLEDFI